jgi:hypothetical protein
VSNQDSFINEVTDEVRRDKLFKMFRRYGWMGALAIVLIVGGAAINEWLKSRAASEAQAAGDAIIVALEAESAVSRAASLAELVPGDNQSRKAIVMLLAADAELDDGNVAGAVAKLEELSDNTSAPTPFRDLATVKAAIIGADTLPPEERVARLNALALSGSAFRLIAMEQIALAEIEMGEIEAAITRLREIVADAGVTQDLRLRATQLIVALGGQLTAG